MTNGPSFDDDSRGESGDEDDRPFSQDGRGDPGEFPGSEHLHGDSPQEILMRLNEGDPLQLWPRCRERLRELAHLVLPTRLWARALAQTAYCAVDYRGRPSLDTWLTGTIDRALDGLLEEDRSKVLLGLPPTDDELEHYSLISIAVDDLTLVKLHVVFNDLPFKRREPFFRTIVEGMTIEQYAQRVDRPIDRVKRVLEKTLETLYDAIEEEEDEEEEERW